LDHAPSSGGRRDLLRVLCGLPLANRPKPGIPSVVSPLFVAESCSPDWREGRMIPRPYDASDSRADNLDVWRIKDSPH